MHRVLALAGLAACLVWAPATLAAGNAGTGYRAGNAAVCGKSGSAQVNNETSDGKALVRLDGPAANGGGHYLFALMLPGAALLRLVRRLFVRREREVDTASRARAVLGVQDGIPGSEDGLSHSISGRSNGSAHATASTRATARDGARRTRRRLTAGEGWEELRQELERSRRHHRQFCLLLATERRAYGARLAPAGLVATVEQAVRRIDTVWLDHRDWFVLLPECGADAGRGLISRLQAENPHLAAAWTFSIAAFPDDALTSGGLVKALARPEASFAPAANGNAATREADDEASRADEWVASPLVRAVRGARAATRSSLPRRDQESAAPIAVEEMR